MEREKRRRSNTHFINDSVSLLKLGINLVIVHTEKIKNTDNGREDIRITGEAGDEIEAILLALPHTTIL